MLLEETLSHMGHDYGVQGRHPLLEGVVMDALSLSTSSSENPRSPNRGRSGTLAFDLLEDAALEFTACDSRMFAWLRSGIFGWRSLFV
jgi:hypothetical protein